MEGQNVDKFKVGVLGKSSPQNIGFCAGPFAQSAIPEEQLIITQQIFVCHMRNTCTPMVRNLGHMLVPKI